jgi:hypothetical protein
MIDLFGGIQFHHVDLYFVGRMSLLLDACAEALETLRLYITDPHSEQFFQKGVEVLPNGFTARSSLRNFGLYRNRSLRALEVMAWSIGAALLRGGSPGPASSLLKHTPSSTTSPAVFGLTVLYRDYRDFRGIRSAWDKSPRDPLRHMSETERAEEASRHNRQFDVFRGAQKVRDFRLVLCADVWERLGEYAVQVLKQVVEVEKAKGVFDNFSSEPVVIYSPRAAIIDA